MSSRSAWATKWAPGQPELQSETTKKRSKETEGGEGTGRKSLCFNLACPVYKRSCSLICYLSYTQAQGDFRVTPSTARTQGLNAWWKGQSEEPRVLQGKSQQSQSLSLLQSSVLSLSLIKAMVSRGVNQAFLIRAGHLIFSWFWCQMKFSFTLDWLLFLGSGFWVAGTIGALSYPNCFSRERNRWFGPSNGCELFFFYLSLGMIYFYGLQLYWMGKSWEYGYHKYLLVPFSTFAPLRLPR